MLSKHICQENYGRQKISHPQPQRCPCSNPQKLNVALLCKKDFEDMIKGLLETLRWIFLDSPVDPIWSGVLKNRELSWAVVREKYDDRRIRQTWYEKNSICLCWPWKWRKSITRQKYWQSLKLEDKETFSRRGSREKYCPCLCLNLSPVRSVLNFQTTEQERNKYVLF